MKGIEELQQAIHRRKTKGSGVLVVVIPGADLHLWEDHKNPVEQQETCILHGKIQIKVQATDSEDNRYR